VSALTPARRALRAAMRAQRASWPAELRRAASAAICDALTLHIPPDSALCATIPLDDEPDLAPWLAAHVAGPGQLWLPRIMAPGVMAFARVFAFDGLVANRHGILEPPADAALERLPPISLALVPGLAFDLAYNRMGQGGGFYDRWLACMRASGAAFVAVGVCFDWQLLDAPLPVEPHDQRVDGVITDRRVIGFS
jgi:5-formyltetrahydrofolate cyclo-ligase